MRVNKTDILFVSCLVAFAATALAAERTVDPTFLHRNLTSVREQAADLTTPGCKYKPIFGEGDADRSALVGIARFGEIYVSPNGSCKTVQYQQEDQVYVVLEGNGSVRYETADVSLAQEDYLSLPATLHHTLKNRSAAPLRVVVLGFRTKGFPKVPLPSKPLTANIEDVPTQQVSGHPSSAVYRLLMGDVVASVTASRPGDREAIAMGTVGLTGKQPHTSLPAVRHLSTNATEVD